MTEGSMRESLNVQGDKTHHIPLLLLLIKQFTRLPHRHADKRILPSASLLMLLPLIATTEHLERLHCGSGSHAFAVVLLSSASATAVHLLMSLHGALLVEVFVGVGLLVAA